MKLKLITTLGSYSPIRQAGDYYYISGQVGVDPDTKKASSLIEDQTRQTLDNLSSVLYNSGLGLDDVVKTSIFLTNIDDFKVVNKLYGDTFIGLRPARSTIGVLALPSVAGDTVLKIEIEAIAYKKRSAK